MLQPSLPYNTLKLSLRMFKRSPQELDDNEKKTIHLQAKEECSLQKKILASKEGMKVVVPEKSIEEAMDVIASRYHSVDSFEQDLTANNLNRIRMAAALKVDLTVEATMALVVARTKSPSEEQVEKVFETIEKELPEQRSARHILITINEEFPENSRREALTRISTIRNKALTPESDFSELAQHYSECPSALQGGSLRPVTRGTIYPSLEETLFDMNVGEISEIVESAMGFHILLCEKVTAGKKLVPDEVKVKIRKSLHARIQKKELQTWLATL